LAKALLPRQRPALIACEKPKAVGPDSSIIVDDLRAFLVEIATEPPRLRQDRELFQKEVERFVEGLEALPAWLIQVISLSPEKRLKQAYDWARRLTLVREKTDQKATRLEISSKGGQWLGGNPQEQYTPVFELLRPLASGRSPYASTRTFMPGIDSPNYYSVGDHRFLGSDVVVIKARRNRQGQRLWDAQPGDLQALRDSLDRAFTALPVGVFYRLDSLIDHMIFQRNNPLLLGLGQEEVLIFQAGMAIPPLAERYEEAARDVIDTFVRQRLIPLGCLQTAIDLEGRLCIARHPRLDAYFGRPVVWAETAGPSAVESKVVVQPDFSIVIIGLNPAPAAELALFCERGKRSGGHGAILLKLTRESVVRAVVQGLKPSEIVARLQRLASTDVPANVLRQVQDWCGWVRRAQASTLTVLRCPDSETADRVQSAMKRQAERLNETMVAVSANKLSTADRNKLRAQGIIVDAR
jgi:hypothetical protein